MKLQLKRTNSEVIELRDYGTILPRVALEFIEAIELIKISREFAEIIHPQCASLLYLELGGVEVPSTIETAQELEEWYLMEVQP